MYGQFPLAPSLAAHDEDRMLAPDHATRSPVSAPLLSASGDTSMMEELLDRPAAKPVASVVSLRELQHPAVQKAIQQAYQAQQLVRANNIPKAIAKLEKAIQIDPQYRDAHCNLGILYTRAGRGPEGLAELRRAVEIGPPAAPVYADLALVSAAMLLHAEAESSARKALELDPRNIIAHRVLDRLQAGEMAP